MVSILSRQRNGLVQFGYFSSPVDRPPTFHSPFFRRGGVSIIILEGLIDFSTAISLRPSCFVDSNNAKATAALIERKRQPLWRR